MPAVIPLAALVLSLLPLVLGLVAWRILGRRGGPRSDDPPPPPPPVDPRPVAPTKPRRRDRRPAPPPRLRLHRHAVPR